MNAMTVDDVVGATLAQATDLTEVRDTHGKVLGFYAPALSGTSLEEHLALDEEQEPSSESADEEDIQLSEHRLATEGKGRTTREVFQRLLSMTDEPALRADLQNKIHALAERDRCDSQ